MRPTTSMTMSPTQFKYLLAVLLAAAALAMYASVFFQFPQ